MGRSKTGTGRFCYFQGGRAERKKDPKKTSRVLLVWIKSRAEGNDPKEPLRVMKNDEKGPELCYGAPKLTKIAFIF